MQLKAHTDSMDAHRRHLKVRLCVWRMAGAALLAKAQRREGARS